MLRCAYSDFDVPIQQVTTFYLRVSRKCLATSYLQSRYHRLVSADRVFRRGTFPIQVLVSYECSVKRIAENNLRAELCVD